MSQPDKIFDALLVLECQAGRRSAMNLLVQRWHSRLCRHAMSYTGNYNQAEDIVQDCWGVILKKIHQLKDPNAFGGWVLRIVTNRALDWLRKQKKKSKTTLTENDLPDTTFDAPDPLDTDRRLRLIQNRINDLPSKQQIVLRLFYLEELSLKQVSTVLGVSLGTVKSRLFNARERLKTTLKDDSYEN